MSPPRTCLAVVYDHLVEALEAAVWPGRPPHIADGALTVETNECVIVSASADVALAADREWHSSGGYQVERFTIGVVIVCESGFPTQRAARERAVDLFHTASDVMQSLSVDDSDFEFIFDVVQPDYQAGYSLDQGHTAVIETGLVVDSRLETLT